MVYKNIYNIIIIKDNYLKEIKDIDMFFKIVKAGFSHPRKQILNNFSKVLKLEKKDTERWLGKKYIDYKKPWQLFKKDLVEYQIILYNLLEGLRHLAWLIQPFMPEKSDQIFQSLGILGQEKKNL